MRKAPDVTGILVTWGNWDLDMHSVGLPSEHEARGQGEASTSQGGPKIAPKHPKPGGGLGQILSHSLRRKQPCKHPDPGLPAFRTVRAEMPLFKSLSS